MLKLHKRKEIRTSFSRREERMNGQIYSANHDYQYQWVFADCNLNDQVLTALSPFPWAIHTPPRFALTYPNPNPNLIED